MTVGSLFSGIGGFDLGLERAGFTVEWQVENNEWCREVLKKHWPKVPCHYDITQIDWRDIPRVDLICGGVPCQPASLAGKRGGSTDARWLWPETLEAVRVLHPSWVLLENVYGLLSLESGMAFESVCATLETFGYEVQSFVIPACAVDAPHIRQRVWIVAHAARELPHRSRPHRAGREESTNGGAVPYAASGGKQSRRTQCDERGFQNEAMPNLGDCHNWPAEPAICRVAHGIPRRVDRLRGLGNAVVPAIVETLGKMILEVEHENLHRMQTNQAVD